MINYKSYYDLARDIAGSIQKLPDCDMVVGIPKSGIVPATIIASYLNVGMIDIDSFAFVHTSRSGRRKQNLSRKRQKVIVVDDSINTGAEFRRVRDRLSAFGENFDFVYCAVYGVEASKSNTVADYILHYVPAPRVFQWNYRNHIIAEHALFDMDGVLCKDPEEWQNDDGDNYKNFVLNAPPLFIPRKTISAIVTSRLERYRPETVEWLDRNGVRYNELIMLDLPSAKERRRLRAHAPFKTEVYKDRSEIIFVESNWKQARHIALNADKPVICTENDIFVHGAEHVKGLKHSGQLFDYESLSIEQELRRQVTKLSRRLTEIDPSYDVDFGPIKNAHTPWHTEVLLEQAQRRNTSAKKSGTDLVAPKRNDSRRRVLMISVSFDVQKGGGAAASSVRLRDSLRAAGDDVFTLSLDDFTEVSRSRDQPLDGTHGAYWSLYHDGSHSRALLSRIRDYDPDIVVLGAVDRGVVSILDIALIDRPILWVCRDNWSHTGGCLFKLEADSYSLAPKTSDPFFQSLTCERYKIGCTNCPIVKNRDERIKSRINYELRRLVYGYRKDIVFAPISAWLERTMKEAPLVSNHLIEAVSNPINVDIVKPVEDLSTDTIRRRFSLPKGVKLVLLGALNLSNERKGVKNVLFQLANDKSLEDVHFVVMGFGEESHEDKTALSGLRERLHRVGFISNEDDKVLLYSAVDVTLVTSLQESLSVVASDSLMCGTPVVSFQTSGLASFLVHKETGYLATPFDVQDLLEGLKWVLSDSEKYRRMSQSARSIAVETFDLKKNVRQLHKLMDRAIEQHMKLDKMPEELICLEKTLGLMGEDLRFRQMYTNYIKKKAPENKTKKAHDPRVLELESNVKNLKREIKMLKKSTSWRITGPLRYFVRNVRSVLGRVNT